ncbi:MAG: Gfo/Idh/MocA family protein [Armatimonadota bacterium]|jgi:predicted dehydrogenase
MIRIGITAAVRFEGQRGCHHGNAFSSMFNGWDAEKAAELGFPTGGATNDRVEGARVVKIYDEDREGAEMMAQIYDIDEVCDSPEELAEGVDAVIVADSGEFDKWKLAVPALEAGLPTFIDKPLAESPEVARQIVEIATANNAPLMSCSSFRWCDAAWEMRDRISGLGKTELLTGVSGQGKFHIYAIHPMEFAFGILGPGVTSVINVGEEDRDVIRLRRADGAQVVLSMYFREVIGGGQMFTVCGESGWHTVDYLGALYQPMMEAFLSMVECGEMPVSGDEMVEVIAVLDAARRSREQGGVEVEI